MKGGEEGRRFLIHYNITLIHSMVSLRAGLRITFSHNQCQNYKQLSPEWALLAERVALPTHHKSDIRFLSVALMHNNEHVLNGT